MEQELAASMEWEADAVHCSAIGESLQVDMEQDLAAVNCHAIGEDAGREEDHHLAGTGSNTDKCQV